MENRRTREGEPHECDERVNKSVERGNHLLESEIQCRYARASSVERRGTLPVYIHATGVKNEWGYERRDSDGVYSRVYSGVVIWTNDTCNC